MQKWAWFIVSPQQIMVMMNTGGNEGEDDELDLGLLT